MYHCHRKKSLEIHTYIETRSLFSSVQLLSPVQLFVTPWTAAREASPCITNSQNPLACCDSWGHKESDMTEWLNWIELNWTEYGHPLHGSQPCHGQRTCVTQWRYEQVKLLSCVQLLATPWIVVHQAPQSMGFSRQEYWSGVPSPSPYLVIGYVNLKNHLWWTMRSYYIAQGTIRNSL